MIHYLERYVMILVGGLWMTKRQIIRIGECWCWCHINRWKTICISCLLHWNLIPVLVFEGLHPRVCILIKRIRLYRRMKRERIEIGEYILGFSFVQRLFILCRIFTSYVYIFVSLHVYHLLFVAASRIIMCPYRVRVILHRRTTPLVVLVYHRFVLDIKRTLHLGLYYIRARV